MSNAAVSATEAREISSEKIFDAPRELVWNTWTDPEHISEWWGPNGFTTTTKHFDFQPGGQWLYTMHGPDGTDYPNEIKYKIVDRPNRLEYEHSEPGELPLFHTTVIFEDLGDKTKLSMRMLFRSQEERDETAEKYGAIEGLNQTLGRLEQFLSERER